MSDSCRAAVRAFQDQLGGRPGIARDRLHRALKTPLAREPSGGLGTAGRPAGAGPGRFRTLTGEAVWWYEYRCYNGRIQRNRCWDSSLCNGWEYTGEACN